MAFLRKLFQGSSKSKREYPNVRRGADPLEEWTTIGELGDGAFGKVFKVCPLCQIGTPNAMRVGEFQCGDDQALVMSGHVDLTVFG